MCTNGPLITMQATTNGLQEARLPRTFIRNKTIVVILYLLLLTPICSYPFLVSAQDWRITMQPGRGSDLGQMTIQRVPSAPPPAPPPASRPPAPPPPRPFDHTRPDAWPGGAASAASQAAATAARAASTAASNASSAATSAQAAANAAKLAAQAAANATGNTRAATKAASEAADLAARGAARAAKTAADNAATLADKAVATSGGRPAEATAARPAASQTARPIPPPVSRPIKTIVGQYTNNTGLIGMQKMYELASQNLQYWFPLKKLRYHTPKQIDYFESQPMVPLVRIGGRYIKAMGTTNCVYAVLEAIYRLYGGETGSVNGVKLSDPSFKDFVRTFVKDGTAWIAPLVAHNMGAAVTKPFPQTIRKGDIVQTATHRFFVSDVEYDDNHLAVRILALEASPAAKSEENWQTINAIHNDRWMPITDIVAAARLYDIE